MMQLKNVLLAAALGVLLFSCSIFKQNRRNINANLGNALVKTDTTKNASGDTAKRNKPKPYKEVITVKAVTDTGLFIVHKVDEQIFFEIPNSLLEKEILVVSRITKAAAGLRPDQFFGYAGDQVGEKVIVFSKGPNDRLFIKLVSFLEKSMDSSENGMYRTVSNSNFFPIVGSFDIKAYSPDSCAAVIDITELATSENQILNFDRPWKVVFGLGALQKDKSYVKEIKSFPINVELRSVNSYVKNEATVTYELNNSFILLPKKPMKPRLRDWRVGYFRRTYTDYDAPQGVDYRQMITRWRLEPKEEEYELYLRGELVEPQKPIVFYIDPATPKKWVPYLIQGVNDWQKAFEKAGFKNAIYALEAPEKDPEWSLYDARHSAIIYKASVVHNASGPNVHDPRSGEILESHINWYHNVMEMLHDWYMIQAGPNDPQARKMVFDDVLMGRLIRFVACHEVGHTLGLAHNFGASWTVPVDSLRSKNYVKKNGFCPSIMDYARFNYVAQPQDGFSQEELMPRIGVYDEWAIEWGYRWLPQLKTKEQETAYMNQWIIGKLEKDKRLWYGPQPYGEIEDPRAQHEDLGDDAIKSSTYAIQNLKRVYANLLEWTKEPNKRYENLSRIQMNVFEWYKLYVSHVINSIGLFETTQKTVEQDGAVIHFVPKEKQKAAVQFLIHELFDTPTWLLNKEIYLRVEFNNPINIITSIHMGALYYLFNFDRYYNMQYFQIMEPENVYTLDELLTDLEKGIFKELTNKSKIDFYRRNLQTSYVEKLIKESNTLPPADPRDEDQRIWKFGTGYVAVGRVHINKIIREINKAIPGYKDQQSKQHLALLLERLMQANNHSVPSMSLSKNEKTISEEKTGELLNCWQRLKPFWIY